jgi:uncharacterized membrane protein (UPF0127 family)
MKFVKIYNQSASSTQPIKATLCDSFWLKFRGLMFKQTIDEYTGILLAESSDSSINTSIHMFFMDFDITAIWINSNHHVVDVKLARRWRPMYVPIAPARFVLETHVNRLTDFQVGDHLEIINV